jgi:hypothetical protein
VTSRINRVSPLPATAVAGPHQGDCIVLRGDTFQVIGLDEAADRCWLRRWPIARQGSPVFELSLHQVRAGALHRPPALPVR